MEYKQFIVKASERKPGKWRASVQPSDGKPMVVTGRMKLDKFVTGMDAATAQDALLMAMVAAIDAETFLASRRACSATSRSVHGATQALN
jgi:hypothetical protein